MKAVKIFNWNGYYQILNSEQLIYVKYPYRILVKNGERAIQFFRPDFKLVTSYTVNDGEVRVIDSKACKSKEELIDAFNSLNRNKLDTKLFDSFLSKVKKEAGKNHFGNLVE